MMSKKCEKDHIIIRNNVVVVTEEGRNRGISLVESPGACTDPDCPVLKEVE